MMEKIAIIHNERQFTYQELNILSVKYARFLTDKNIKKGDSIAISCGRSIECVALFIAALKIGAPYVYIDPLLPLDRKNFIASDSNVKTIFLDEKNDQWEVENVFNLFDEQILNSETQAVTAVLEPNDPAFYIYTSGTTGKPKGAELTHGNLASFIHWCKEMFAETPFETVLAGTSFSFDLCIYELHFSLSAGKTIVLLENSLFIKEALPHYRNVIINTVPSVMLELLSNDVSVENAVAINLAGEPISKSLKELLPYQQCEIRNLYGPTENSTYSTCKLMMSADEIQNIGSPVPNTKAFILDENFNLLPKGCKGELFLGGEGVAQKYIGLPALTEEKFCRISQMPEERLYRTGDLVRWLPNGDLEFFGRKDNQIKINGFRIELGEIENCIAGFEPIREAAVIYSNQKETLGVHAFYTENHFCDITLLKQHLRAFLPIYMHPVSWTCLNRLPLNSNGKIDKKELEKLIKPASGDLGYWQPENDIEKAVADCWKEVTGRMPSKLDEDFFASGGNSIQLMKLSNSYVQQFGVKIPWSVFFRESTFIQHIEFITAYSILDKEEEETIKPVKLNKYPLSSGQKRFYVLSQMDNSSSAYNVSVAFRIQGEVDKIRLEQAIRQMVDRHEILRTKYVMTDEQLEQVVIRTENIKSQDWLKEYQFTSENIEKELNHFTVKPFVLDEAPLMRVGLFYGNTSDVIVSCCMHHSITDAWSMELFMEEIFSNYQMLSANPHFMPEPLQVQYKDYAFSQLTNAEIEDAKLYWMDQFQEEVPALEFAPVLSRPKIKTFNGKTSVFSFGESLNSEVNSFCNTHHISHLTFWVSQLNILFYRYTGQKDQVIGSPVSLRNRKILENQLGLYLNTLPFRCRFENNVSLIDLVKQNQTNIAEGLKNSEFPFEDLVQALQVSRQTDRHPLFDVFLVYQDTQTGADTRMNTDIIFEKIELRNELAIYDLTFFITKSDTGILLNLEYNTDVFSAQIIDQLGSDFIKLVASSIMFPELPVASLHYLEDSLTEPENNRSLNNSDKTLLDLFHERVSQSPNALAMISPDNLIQIDYQTLNLKSDQLAGLLKSKYSVQKFDRISVSLYKSEEWLVTILALLKLRAVYVPIDPGYPLERQKYMLADSSSVLLIDHAWIKENYSSMAGYALLNPETVSLNTDPLYVVYTSGSTGQPKGIEMPQSSISNLIQYQINETSLKGSRMLLFTNISFDVSVQEIYYGLATGIEMYCYNDQTLKDSTRLVEIIASESIDILYLPTSFTKLMLQDKHFTNLLGNPVKHIITAGEKLILPADYPSIFDQSSFVLHNHYGPAETHVVTCFEIDENYNGGQIPPIGKKISGVELYLLDGNRQKVGHYIVGEIYLGGLCLSNGYVGKEELTNEKFVDNPFLSAGKMYKTGDLAYSDTEGNLHYISRVDNMLKVDGYRVEPTEIEKVASSVEGVDFSFVNYHIAPGDRIELILYYESKDGLTEKILRKKLEDLLPSYMIPKFILLLDKIPINRNGKVDKIQLPAPADQFEAEENTIDLSQTEKDIQSLIETVLGRKISLKTNFFEAGGNSLTGLTLVGKIHQLHHIRLSLYDIYQNPTIQKIAERIGNAIKNKYIPITPVGQQKDYPLSSSQLRFWMLHQFEHAQNAFNITNIYQLPYAVDEARFRLAARKLAEKHPVLKSVYKMEGADVRMRFPDQENVNFYLYTDLSEYPDAEEKMLQIEENASLHVFNLEESCCLIHLIRLSSEKYCVLFSVHHIASDLWSQKIIIEDLFELYNDSHQIASKKVSPDIHYPDYVSWLSRHIDDQHDTLKTYWTSQFDDEIQPLNFDFANPRPVVQSYSGNVFSFNIQKDAGPKIKTYLKDRKLSLFMFLSSVLSTLLFRYTGNKKIVIGTPVSGRVHPDTERMAGLFINMLPFKFEFDSEAPFKAFVSEVKNLTLSNLENQIYPFDRLVNDLNLQKDMSRSPLFDVTIVVQNIQQQAEQESSITQKEVNTDISQTDLSFIFQEINDTINCVIEYNSSIFEAEDIQAMSLHFNELIGSVVENDSLSVGQLNYLTDEEKKEILEDVNQTNRNYERSADFYEVLVKISGEYPKQIAVEDGIHRMTYQELISEIDKLSAFLMLEELIVPGDRVAVSLKRTVHPLVIMLAIMKIGAVYIPIDYDFPEERAAYILQNSKAKCLFTDEAYLTVNSIDKIKIILIEELQQLLSTYEKSAGRPAFNEKAYAYIMYTSGSTGQPKGVPIAHFQMMDYAWMIIEMLDVNKDSIVLQQASLGFDTSIEEIFPVLCVGGKVSVYNEGMNDLDLLIEVLIRRKVSLLSTVPLILNEINTRKTELPHLKTIISAGDELKPEYIDWLVDQCEVYNLYGPTESTVSATYNRVLKPEDARSIGKPLNNRKIYILDENNQPVRKGIVGEICISGPMLTEGYLDLPDVNREKFIENSFVPNDNLYKTGDLGMWNRDMQILYKGRKDFQIQVQGNRVELGEVEYHASQITELKEVLIHYIVDEWNEKQLVLYYVTDSETLTLTDIRLKLKQKLPDFMIPTNFVKMERFPTNANGKIDRKQLPSPDLIQQQDPAEIKSPGNDTEEIILAIWKEVLKKKQISTDSVFFEVGGNSIKLIRLHSLLKNHFEKGITIVDLFNLDTIEKQAAYYTSEKKKDAVTEGNEELNIFEL